MLELHTVTDNKGAIFYHGYSKQTALDILNETPYTVMKTQEVETKTGSLYL